MKISRSAWITVALAILALLALCFSFPVLLFTCYPWAPALTLLYLASLVPLLISSLRTDARPRLRRITHGILSLPILVLLSILIALAAGWLSFPG